MPALPLAQRRRPAVPEAACADICALSYEGRFLRRRVLTAAAGLRFLVDLPQATSLDAGDALELGDGRLIAIRAAPEPLLMVRGPDLARLAWHIGNRHTPCQIGSDRLLIRRDPVIARMLDHLGAALTEITAPFTPEGGAYGHGRTQPHDHGASARTSHGPGGDGA